MHFSNFPTFLKKQNNHKWSLYDFIGIEIHKLKFKKNILRQTAGRNHNKLHAYSFKAYVTFNLTKSHRSVTNVVPWKCFAIKGIGRSDDNFLPEVFQDLWLVILLVWIFSHQTTLRPLNPSMDVTLY